LLERIFGLARHGTGVRTELAAGATTFLTMAYIVAVNPAILGQAGMPAAGVADGVTDHWFRLTETSPVAAAEVAGCDVDPVAELELEHAAVPTTSAASKSPIHLVCPRMVRSFQVRLVRRATSSEDGRARGRCQGPNGPLDPGHRAPRPLVQVGALRAIRSNLIAPAYLSRFGAHPSVRSSDGVAAPAPSTVPDRDRRRRNGVDRPAA